MTETKEKIIRALIKQRCFVFEGGPFVSSAGFNVPFFIDVRGLFSDPDILRDISEELLKECRKNGITVLAGAETAGIPFASAMSVIGNLPLFYVRKEKQNHGTESVIAGIYPKETDKIALIDDSIGGGGSAKTFVANLEAEGFGVDLFLYILEMNIWNNSEERMIKLCSEHPGFKYCYLVTWEEWINYMCEKGIMSETLRDVCLESAKEPLLFSDKGKMEWYKREKEKGNIWFK